MHIAVYRPHRPGVRGSIYIVRSFRDENGKPRQERLLNVSHLEEPQIQALRAILKGQKLVDWDQMPGLQSRQFGLVHAALSTLRKLGLPEILGPRGLQHWPALAAMILNRIDRPSSKYSLKHWITDTALCDLLGQADESFCHEKACYAALDWLAENQTAVEDQLYRLRGEPPTLFLYDLTSTYFEGAKAELGAFGYSRDHRPDRKQICIGILGDMDGFPVATEVFEGSTRDSTTVPAQLRKMKARFGCEKAVFVGDRGMITLANKESLEAAGLDFILALQHREVLDLVEAHGPWQMGLFDETGLADIAVDGRRLVVCRNPVAGDDTRRRRETLISLSEEKLHRIQQRVAKGALKKAAAIQRSVDRWLPRWKTEKFFTLSVEDGCFEWRRNEVGIAAAARLDGVYVLETSESAEALPAKRVQRVYQNLQAIERAFRSLKHELEIRPVRHWRAERIRGHVFLCVLAYSVEQFWRKAIAGLPEAERPEWRDLKETLRRWRKVCVPGWPDLKAKDENFTTETARYLSYLGVAVR